MILRILPLLLIVLVLPTWYSYHHFIQHKTTKKWLRVAYWLPSLLLVIMAFLLGIFQTHSPLHATCVNIFMLCFFIFSVPKLIFTLISLVGLALRSYSESCWRLINLFANIVRWITFVSFIYATIWGAYNFKVKEITYHSADLPDSFDGYRIVHFSDIHLGTFHSKPSAVKRIVDLINAQNADALLFTGDIVNYRASELIPFVQELSRLHAKDGVFSVLGNHDYAEYVAWERPEMQTKDVEYLTRLQRDMGWNLLLNESKLITRNNQQIAVVGVENDGKPPFPERGDLAQALSQADTIPFKILLSHDPSHWHRKVLPETDIQLTLSGHTHAMQFALFGWTPAKWFYPENWGVYYHDDRVLNVSGGVGNVMFAFRLGAWPEITCITLRKQ